MLHCCCCPGRCSRDQAKPPVAHRMQIETAGNQHSSTAQHGRALLAISGRRNDRSSTHDDASHCATMRRSAARPRYAGLIQAASNFLSSAVSAGGSRSSPAFYDMMLPRC